MEPNEIIGILLKGLRDIAEGNVERDSEPSRMMETCTPAEFQSAMWTWSQAKARAAIAAASEEK